MHYIFIRIGSECYAGHFQVYASGHGLQQRVQPDRWGIYIGRDISEIEVLRLYYLGSNGYSVESVRKTLVGHQPAEIKHGQDTGEYCFRINISGEVTAYGSFLFLLLHHDEVTDHGTA